jgi:hypothetical protein
MSEKPITIEFKYPWTMMPLEHSSEWIEIVKKSLEPTDPLFKKDIFVSGRHEFKKLLLIENDTDNNYAIVSIKMESSSRKYISSTISLYSSRQEFANKLQQDYEVAIKEIKAQEES